MTRSSVMARSRAPTIQGRPWSHIPSSRRSSATPPRGTATPLDGRERISEAAFAAALVATSVVAARRAARERPRRSAGPRSRSSLLCAVAGRVEFTVGAGSTTAEDRARPDAPAAAARARPAAGRRRAGAAPRARVPAAAAPIRTGCSSPSPTPGRRRARRVIIALAAPGAPALEHWPVYLAALGAQLGLDLGSPPSAQWAAFGVPPVLQAADDGADRRARLRARADRPDDGDPRLREPGGAAARPPARRPSWPRSRTSASAASSTRSRSATPTAAARC